ncbi:MAG: cysteine synthase A, partial [Myxococcales bacterium]
MTVIHDSILELIGNTPLVRLRRLSQGGAEIVAKIEMRNPGGSVKDRIALAMIEDAEKAGLLAKGSTIIEATSGNTGIGLAMVAAVKGYQCVIVMPDDMSLERRYILKTFGAKVVLTSALDGMTGAVQKAEQLAASTPGSFMPRQFRNGANPSRHYATTGPEIAAALGGRLDAFVAGVGTGGTLTGVGRFLREKYPELFIAAVEPAKSAVLSGGRAGVHGIQGIGAGFVPEVLDRALIARVFTVKDDEAKQTAARLASEEGIFAGISSGAAAFAAVQRAGERGGGGS